MAALGSTDEVAERRLGGVVMSTYLRRIDGDAVTYGGGRPIGTVLACHALKPTVVFKLFYKFF
jgi:hypothetical protein